MPNPIARRTLIQGTVAATLSAALTTSTRAADPAPPKAIRLGVIGTGSRGTYHIRLALGGTGVEIAAICDINSANLERAAAMIEKAGRKRPVTFAEGPQDYRRMLGRDDLDAVLIATPVPMHAPMAIDAMKAKKHVLSEVGAAMTLDECWGLVRTARETGKVYMLAENVCYTRQNMTILEMSRKNLFGAMTYAECGYAHDCRALFFDKDGALTWRGEMKRDNSGNTYPTHAIGPVAQWMGINRGDRFVSLTAYTSDCKSIYRYAAKKFPEGHPARQVKFQSGDTTTVLIRTARGAVIDLRYDISSARPHTSTTWFGLQGESASYKDDGLQQQIWIEGKNKKFAFEPLADHQESFDAALWKANAEQAMKTGHGGCDWFVLPEFLNAVRAGGPSPIDAVDAATWSSIIPLSAASIKAGGAPQDVPDFTDGAWEKSRG